MQGAHKIIWCKGNGQRSYKGLNNKSLKGLIKFQENKIFPEKVFKKNRKFADFLPVIAPSNNTIKTFLKGWMESSDWFWISPGSSSCHCLSVKFSACRFFSASNRL
jgi:hypothetical protein